MDEQEDNTDQGIVSDVDLEPVVDQTQQPLRTKTTRRTPRPSSRQEGKTTGSTDDTPEESSTKTVIEERHGIENLAISDSNDRAKKTSVIVDCEEDDEAGHGEHESLMKNIKKQRKSSIVGYFPKESHTVAVKPPAKRQRTISSASKAVEIASENENSPNVVKQTAKRQRSTSSTSKAVEVASENNENSPMVTDENTTRIQATTISSPSTTSARTLTLNSPMLGKRTRATAANETANNAERRHVGLLKQYSGLGEQLLVQTAADAPDIVMLPDLDRPKDHDYCLINVSSLFSENADVDVPPKPHPFGERGDSKFNENNFISLPWAQGNVSTDGVVLHSVIERELRHIVNNGLSSMVDLKILMKRLYSTKDITALEDYFEALDSERKRNSFFNLVCGIAELALRGKELFPGSLPVCDTSEGSKKECSVTLSQEQCACLLACSFFGIFPEHRRENFNDFNMTRLLDNDTTLAMEKLRFIVSYFSNVLTKMPAGVVSFRRCAISLSDTSRLLNQELSLSKVVISKEPIEKCHHALQVDFANKYIGGGVLGHGAVQEEIRFLCCPEMIVSLLLCPRMKDNEAIFIVGAQQYSSYTGYAETLRFKRLEGNENQVWDRYRRLRCQVVAIDAISFPKKNSQAQFTQEKINRELTKALVGFTSLGSNCIPVATGNWGCGAFHGDIELKCMIQLIAASAACRPIVYCPFNEEKSAVEFCYLSERLVKKGVSIADLLAKVLRYKPYYNNSLFEFLTDFVQSA